MFFLISMVVVPLRSRALLASHQILTARKQGLCTVSIEMNTEPNTERMMMRCLLPGMCVIQRLIYCNVEDSWSTTFSLFKGGTSFSVQY